LRTRLSEISEQHARAEKELLSARTSSETKLNHLIKEKENISNSSERVVEQVHRAHSSSLAQLQEEYLRECSEQAAAYEKAMRETEERVQVLVEARCHSEKIAALASAEKKAAREIEGARAEERGRAAAELDKMKKHFLEREQQTICDLRDLEALQRSHVQRLEQEAAALRARAQRAEDAAAQIQVDAAKEVQSVRKIIENQQMSNQSNAIRAESVDQLVQNAHREIQDAKAAEIKYREKLRLSLEENARQRCALLEAQRQASTESAEVAVLRQSAHEAVSAAATLRRSLVIAQEEVSMLEHDLQRSREENSRLIQSLSYADKIVYGKPTVSKVSAKQSSETSSVFKMTPARKSLGKTFS
jgi:hypothetical protein